MVDSLPGFSETSEPNTLYIGKGVTIRGDISASRLVIIEGRAEGHITAHAIWVGPSGSFKGVLCVTEADLHGLVSDKILVKECLRIHPTGRVVGDVRYRDLILERGGTISGTCAPINADREGFRPRIGEILKDDLDADVSSDLQASVVTLFQK